MTIQIREYEKTDVNEAVKIWNQVVEDGEAFPQMEFLTEKAVMNFSGNSHLLALLTMKRQVKLQVCISSTRTISGAVVISATPAMP